ncbi:polysaccharide deacetylase family protein [Streptomyces sp. RB6PN25]|uniref:Polysaccharide deacetylase family protein n=1 Tax=Streptomyces humicola TaxID=2953240 RepID=A0ABT1Q459_9ACTN|nr:polysaccharide deacetylase family protein [Streptomyces humicola]MCQ4084717.1 polysaccharide deacetylase family protein [Streptomyces humicola]
MAVSRRAVLWAAMAGGTLAGCGTAPSRTPVAATPTPRPGSAAPSPSATADVVTREEVIARYGRMRPTSWGFDAPGVLTELPHSTERRLALTFDACGGRGGSGYDARLIDVLRGHRTPATLFLNSRWIDANPTAFRALAADPLFELANHGTKHRPLSVTGRSAYGIPGTRSAGEVYDEVAGNQQKLTGLLGRPPRFFRSGTAYCDDVAVRIVSDLGERAVSFNVNGDGGATFTPREVYETVIAAPAGSLIIGHMNHPEGGTAEGMALALPRLLGTGHRFVRLSDAVSAR